MELKAHGHINSVCFAVAMTAGKHLQQSIMIVKIIKKIKILDKHEINRHFKQCNYNKLNLQNKLDVYTHTCLYLFINIFVETQITMR